MKAFLLAHWLYLSYVVRHKLAVYKFGMILRREARFRPSWWRLVIHDWTKFGPSEWVPYVNYFYRGGGVQAHRDNSGHYDPTKGPLAFNVAWLHHQHFNPHHWQHWVLLEDSGAVKPLPMPEHLAAEMVADWAGAGWAQGFREPTALLDWYRKNRSKMQLHDMTERRVLVCLRALTPPILGCLCGAESSLPEQCRKEGYCEVYMTRLPEPVGAEAPVIASRH